MACSRRLRISSRDIAGASGFLAFSNFNHTLDNGPITKRVLFCIFSRISSLAKELFLFFSFNIRPLSWLGSSCLVLDVLHRLIREDISLGCMCLCIRCKLRREVPFKLIFIWYSVEPLGFLVFFLTLRDRGIRRRWKRRRTRRSFPLLLFTLLFISLLSSSRWRRDWEEEVDGMKKRMRSCFLIFLFLRDLHLFGLESPWIALCFIFELWEPSSSFSSSLLRNIYSWD